jgi:DNA ligase-1
MEALPKQLKSVREHLGFSLSEVSQQTGIGASSLSEFENGKREPSLTQLQKLATMYDKPISFFLEEQAVAEAKSKWEKKVKSGYVESKKDAEKGKNELGGYPPMLAKSAADIHEKYLTFPCYIQPKLDGLRCVSTLDGQYSRTRKPLNFPHIQKEIDRIRKEYPELAQAEFDGEIYLHKMSDNFQDLMSIARKENHPQQHILEYHVYDIIDDSKSFTDRYVKPFSKLKLSGPVKVVPTFLCKNQEEVDALEQRFIEEGYEGAMRRTDAPYEFKRSANLLKIKRFEDSEFEVLGIEEGRGKLATTGCITL